MPERAHISVEKSSTSAVITTTERKGTLGDPYTLSDSLHGPHFTRWSRYYRINLVLYQLKLVDGRADLDTVGYFPHRTRNLAHRILTGALNELMQVLEFHVCFRFSFSTSTEALYVEETQNVLVYLNGDVYDVVSGSPYAYSLRAVLLLSLFAPVESDVFPYRLEWQVLTEVRRLFTHED